MLTGLPYRLALGLLVVAAVAGGVFLAVRAQPRAGVEVLFPTPTPTPELKVYVSGAVRDPGVYGLLPGDRVEQALAAAGGARPDADLSRVNLAQRLHDQDHVYVPRLGESLPSPTLPARINLNTAPASALATLPGIGPAKAQAIVDYRETHGPFARVDQLMQVSGIGPATYEALRELVMVE